MALAKTPFLGSAYVSRTRILLVRDVGPSAAVRYAPNEGYGHAELAREPRQLPMTSWRIADHPDLGFGQFRVAVLLAGKTFGLVSKIAHRVLDILRVRDNLQIGKDVVRRVAVDMVGAPMTGCRAQPDEGVAYESMDRDRLGFTVLAQSKRAVTVAICERLHRTV